MASSGKTGYYQLNQWTGGDYVLRNDFNADNEIIDNVLGSFSRSMGEINKTVSNQQYNIIALLLLNHYESKFTGSKRALYAEAFIDYGCVESLTACGVDRDGGFAYAGTAGQDSISFSNTSKSVLTSSINVMMCQMVYLKGYGKLTHLNFDSKRNTTGTQTATFSFELYSVEQGKISSAPVAQYSASDTYGYLAVPEVRTYTLGTSVALTPGAYMLKFGWSGLSNYVPPSVYEGDITGYGYGCSAAGTPLGYSYSVTLGITSTTPSSKTGTLVTLEQDVLTSYESAVAYVRHNSMPVAVEISGDSGGTWKMMSEATPAQQVTSFGGVSCYETKYTLSDVPAAPNNKVKIRFTLTGGSSADCKVYDFGVVMV